MLFRDAASKAVVALGLAAGMTYAQQPTPTPVQQEIDQLRQRLDQLEQQQKAQAAADAAAKAAAVAAAAAAPKAVASTDPSAASVTADTGGFVIKSNDGNFSLKIGADLQVDNRSFFGTGSSSLSDTILLRRVRPTFSGTIYHNIDYFFRPDFGQGNTVIYDAYVQLNYFSRAKLRVGKFKPPVGLERLQSDDDTTFVERGLPTLLVPSRDIGFQLSGDIISKRVNYSVGVFNGVADNGLSDAAVSSHRDYAARLFFTPWAPETKSPLSGLGFGIGATSGNVDGEALPAYKTFGQNTFVSFASGVTEAGHRTRLAPGAYYYVGPFGLYAEYGLTEEGLQMGIVRTDVGFRAYQVAASYILTGEKKGFTNLTPRKSFDPAHNGWGAWELAVRTGEFEAEKGLYNYGFATSTASARESREWVGGVNWYLNRLFRISADYGRTSFEGGAAASAGGNRPDEKLIIFRFQINFI